MAFRILQPASTVQTTGGITPSSFRPISQEKKTEPVVHKPIEILRAEAMVAEKEAGKSLAGRFIKELPGAATQEIVGRPAQFVTSAVLSPVDIVRGIQGKEPIKKEIDLPGLKPFKTIQAMAGEEVSAGEAPAWAITKGVGRTALGALETLGLAKGVKTVSGVAKKGLEKAGVIKTEVEKIAEKIMPKPTIKEARLAQREGRLIKGREPSLFKGGKPDIVLPSEKVSIASETIQKNIPNASKMKTSELFNALDDKVAKTAEELEPTMKSVPLKKETANTMVSKWETLKSKQSNTADFIDNEAGNLKLQTQFENRLKSLSEKNNMDDVWKTAIDYDNSVPKNIKEATELSDSKLQYRKEMWLENRKILRDIIKDIETGLNETARKSFSEMHDMYNAMRNLESSAKIKKVGEPSKIIQFIKKHPVVSTVVTGGAVSATGIPEKIWRAITK